MRNGSALPVLVLDAGSELTNAAIATLGAANVVSMLPTAVTDANFNASLYSAFAVASEFTCGGCDNTPADNAAIATHLAAIGAFVTAGGGVLGFAGAADPLAYAYVPTAAANGGGNPPSNGFVETAAGNAAGLLAENGDPTHNFFPSPGTGGLSGLFQVAEVNGSNPCSSRELRLDASGLTAPLRPVCLPAVLSVGFAVSRIRRVDLSLPLSVAAVGGASRLAGVT